MKTDERGNFGDHNIGDHNIGDQNRGDKNFGNHNHGDQNDGNHNFGKHNIGHTNIGNYNRGYGNFGGQNYGDQNHGHNNIGDQNFGDYNFGTHNGGDNNIGAHNFGYYNRGNHNRGHYNYTDGGIGCFNTKPTSEYRLFNKPYDRQLNLVEIPLFLRDVQLTTWIPDTEMTEQEKRNNPSYETCGGYLRPNDYEEVIRKAWDAAPEAERRAVLDLPNWNNEIFKEITGIDVEEELQNQSQPNKED